MIQSSVYAVWKVSVVEAEQEKTVDQVKRKQQKTRSFPNKEEKAGVAQISAV